MSRFSVLLFFLTVFDALAFLWIWIVSAGWIFAGYISKVDQFSVGGVFPSEV